MIEEPLGTSPVRWTSLTRVTVFVFAVIDAEERDDATWHMNVYEGVVKGHQADQVGCLLALPHADQPYGR